jgi:uncharacterized membrane protein YcaP (DUF421 family)
MQPQNLKLTDWMRILIGEVPGGFYIELIIRAAFIYLLLMLSMRMLGKRMSSQLGRTEMVSLVTLAAAIGIPLQTPERGLIPAIIIALIIVFIGRWIAAKAVNDQDFEHKVQGNVSILVNDSVFDLEEMRKVRLTRERLVAQLRSASVKQLGQVKRLYLEAGGSFSIIKEEKPKPGLSLIPHWDEELDNRFQKSEDWVVCQTCGATYKTPQREDEVCKRCKSYNWTAAVL